MEEATDVDSLHRKRAHRRGLVTRIQRKANAILERPLGETPRMEVLQLQSDLAQEIERHDALHELIEDALTDQAQALHLEQK